MIDLTIVVCGSLLCLFIHVAVTFPEMILNSVDRFLVQHHAPEWLIKPLYACLPCMGVYYGTLLTVGLTYMTKVQERVNEDVIFVAVLQIVMISGLNALIALFIRLIEAIEEINE